MLGVHCSISGGYQNAFIEAQRLGIQTFQIFTKNQRQWAEKTITIEDAKIFRKDLKDFAIKKAFSHCTYLINLASADESIRKQSVLSLAAEVRRCDTLGLAYAVMHPGSCKDITEKEAIQRIIDGLNIVIEATADCKTKILLENTAGQGSSIGWKLEHLQSILKETGKNRTAVCIDTCHAFAAGYDISNEKGIEDFFNQVEKTIKVKTIKAFHFNDSKGALGSRIDRHENIGKGKIGLVPFKYIQQNFPDIPKVLETPKEGDMDWINLELLRKLVG
ncbi:MAG: deoxyribonuclease IV [Cytophagaceae bacterium]